MKNNESMHVLLTGASGFVGTGVLGALRERGVAVRPVVRSASSAAHMEDTVVVPRLDVATDWTAALHGVTVVIHCAARAHIMRDEALDPLAEYRRVNVDGTLALARQAAAAGVKRFVFVSSIGVNGGQTFGKPFIAEDTPQPEEPYALSKWEAEQALQTLAADSDMELVVIRPPLVYGPNAPGNFGRLINAVRRGMWLPLGAVHNRRTLVALGNLVDLILLCSHHPAAAGQIFLAGDGEDLSTTQLLRGLGDVMERPARLLPVPVAFMALGAGMLGRKGLVNKICGDLQVDISKTRELLGWNPPLTVTQGLQKAVEGNR